MELVRSEVLTVAVVLGLPVVSPRLQRIIEAPAGCSRADAVLDLQRVAELVEVAAGAAVGLQGLPRQEVLLHCHSEDIQQGMS